MLLASHEVRYMLSCRDGPLKRRLSVSEKSSAKLLSKSPPFIPETHVQVSVRVKSENETDPFIFKPDKKDAVYMGNSLSVKGTWQCEGLTGSS